MTKQFVNHFQSFLGDDKPVDPLSNNVNFRNKVTIEESEIMTRQKTDEEVKRAMWGIDENKAPGPNGYTSGFFKKKAWSIVGKDVCSLVKEFFVRSWVKSML